FLPDWDSGKGGEADDFDGNESWPKSCLIANLGPGGCGYREAELESLFADNEGYPGAGAICSAGSSGERARRAGQFDIIGRKLCLRDEDPFSASKSIPENRRKQISTSKEECARGFCRGHFDSLPRLFHRHRGRLDGSVLGTSGRGQYHRFGPSYSK